MRFSFRDLNPRWVGAATIVLAGGVIAAVFAVATLGVLDDRYTMTAVFTDSAGLRRGDAVRVAGIDVGEVTGVRPDFELGQVVVTFEVDRGVELGPDTRADIALATLLGGLYLRLENPPGPIEQPYYSTLPEEARRIPLSRTGVPATVNDVLDDATRAVDALDVENVETLLGQLGDLTLDSGEDIGALAANLAAVAGALTERRAQIDALIADTERVTSLLAAKDEVLGALVDQASQLLGRLSARRDQLQVVLGAGSEVVVALSGLIEAHRTSLEAVLDDLHATFAVTDAHLPDLNRTLALVGPTFEGIGRATQQGAWLDAVASGLPAADLHSLIQELTGGGG